ncbi:ABC transporter permease [Staphylococcus simiae]|uniref:FtsX-like permease family protein n=1 Tax=Staphylococcus simiae TaxID=308354 RepID=UPI001A95CE4A|nr:FtsX-like permease family protein [Staphylococcus simiae]MBO1198838.1 ABC transporter permease [Staphylococcus simiae]MBO1201035.1 ABC transporter permease [Staphylococcus simiae]MBO1203851.1 ABC transporter permease [Staphylococcus simiae]MBO1211075.1 ABC transporter permease [Staphylococcus simiae]MBO1229372.1 ABC transporter permease [Staphylococcus simiae]
MSFNEIIFKNFKQNLPHYAIYLFSIVISVVLHFSFVTLKYAHKLNTHENYPIIKEGSQVGSYFLFVIIMAFLLYANVLFIKRRSYELSLFQTLGLSKLNIIYILMFEQLLLFGITAILGIIIGIFGSKILLMIVLRILAVKAKVPVIFSIKAILDTLLLIGIAYLLTTLQNFIYIMKKSITELSNDFNSKEIEHHKMTYGEIILGLLGVVLILAGYYLSLNIVKYYDSVGVLLFILLASVIGAYLFFKSSVALAFKTVKKIRRGIISVSDVMFTSSIMYRIKKNAFSLTVMAIISAITVSVLCFAAISRASLASELLYNSPHDVTLKDQQQANNLAYELNNRKIAHYYNYKEVVYTKLYKDKLFDIKMKEPYQVTVTSDKYIPNTDVKRGQADLLVAEGAIKELVKHKDHGQAVLGTKKHHLNITVHKDIDKIYFMSSVDRGGPTFVLNDHDFQKLRMYAKTKNIVSQYGFDLTHKKDAVALEMAKNSVNKNIQTKSEAANSLSGLTGILLFVTSFLGISFLIAVSCIIYIKQIDETEDELDNYIILRKLGFTQKDMAKGLKLKIMFNFGLPLIIALSHAYFASLAYMKVMGTDNQRPIFIVMIIYTCIYAIFAITAYNHSKRTIRHSI